MSYKKEISNFKLSLLDAVEDIFTDINTFGAVYNVYYESDLRNATVPTFPYLYVLDSGVPFPVAYLPVVTVYLQPSYRYIELGSTLRWHFEVDVEIYAANRGQREDFAAAICDGLGDFTIYDKGGSSDASWGTGIIQDRGGTLWEVIIESINDEQAVEGTLLNWIRCHASFWAQPS